MVKNKLRRDYRLSVFVNELWFDRVTIDPHYEEKHKDVINDKIILELVKMLDGGSYFPQAVDGNGFEYFVNDPWEYKGLIYRLVWLIPSSKSFIGVRNAFRRK